MRWFLPVEGQRLRRDWRQPLRQQWWDGAGTRGGILLSAYTQMCSACTQWPLSPDLQHLRCPSKGLFWCSAVQTTLRPRWRCRRRLLVGRMGGCCHLSNYQSKRTLRAALYCATLHCAQLHYIILHCVHTGLHLDDIAIALN